MATVQKAKNTRGNIAAHNPFLKSSKTPTKYAQQQDTFISIEVLIVINKNQLIRKAEMYAHFSAGRTNDLTISINRKPTRFIPAVYQKCF